MALLQQAHGLHTTAPAFAVPRNKVSTHKRGLRRMGKGLKPRTNLTPCRHCGFTRTLHRVCSNCGLRHKATKPPMTVATDFPQQQGAEVSCDGRLPVEPV